MTNDVEYRLLKLMIEIYTDILNKIRIRQFVSTLFKTNNKNNLTNKIMPGLRAYIIFNVRFSFNRYPYNITSNWVLFSTRQCEAPAFKF